MPIAIFEIPREGSTDVPQAKKLCEDVGEIVHNALGVPAPDDKEIRVAEGTSDKPRLRIAFTVGPNEYPDYKPPSFFPTTEAIRSAGQAVAEAAKKSPLGISEAVVEAWRDTTFLLREEELPRPVSPMSAEDLKAIGRRLENPRIKLVLSPQKREGSSPAKEQDAVPQTESQKVSAELARRMAEILGSEVPIAAEVEFAAAADTDIAVEFDCETVEGQAVLPESARRFMAKTALQVLDGNPLTREGSAEVWIRQGRPEVQEFEII
jgi:hypothetical protein